MRSAKRPTTLLLLPSLLVSMACTGNPPPPAAPHPNQPEAPLAPPASAAAAPAPARRAPDVPTRREDVVETLHGKDIHDPYRWLEDGDSDEVKAWQAAQNERTAKALSSLPGRAALTHRIESLLRIGSVGTPAVYGSKKGQKGRYFSTRQAPSEDQPVLYVRDGVDGVDRKLVDPNTRGSDGLVSLDFWVPSQDGKKLAYGLSSGGDEQSTLYVMDVETGKDLPETEVIPRARYASVAWLPDGKSFYYTRYPKKGDVPAGEEHYHRKVYLHQLGRSWEKDPLVFGEGRAMTDSPSVAISPNGRWLVASVHMGWSRVEAYLLDRTAGPKATFVPIAVPKESAIYDVDVYDDVMLVRTNDGAPTYELYRVDPKKPAREHWQKILPATKDVLQAVTSIGGQLFATYIVDAHSVVKRFSATGEPKGEITLPTIGTTGGASGEWDGHEAFLGFTSFAVPSTVLRFDLTTEKVNTWAEIKPPVDASEFVVTQEKARSKDGTMVPYFLVHKKGVARDGKAPAVLTGYGGFNIAQMPAFAGSRYVMLEQGGVVAVANLRGGGEYGEAWHRAGMLGSKQNVFDDLYAVAEELIADRVTSSDRLAVMGGSNGGLLVGAAITQRPDLFRAAVCAVPLLDMIRYHKFLIAKLWIPEYGSAEDASQFEWLWAYSPYHNVKAGTPYPAVLFATAEGDSRVDPLHARKMAALLQAEAGGDKPILLRVEGKAGHGAGKPISKRIEEATDVYSFLFWQLGVTPPG
ncbi:prolyl oligopeptidase family serine peptidase [Polyangium sorediatum]|uniref:prolyl oligopeptidase n=1 Tax=Polyangium sorediatum TaxID=889274 RepID=A0ABT6NS85_9BACT|nr:prolyl oligopeptidase family serine peptidase [Polyangium sorediatum]MDI1431015.1 prolyl oligopeptidase family serine peptidase [Polyangium sorediatum]